MASILDDVLSQCSYGGVPFWIKRGAGLPTTFRFDSVGTKVIRYAPGSFPAVASIQVINTGLYTQVSKLIYLKEDSLAAMRSKVLSSFQNIVLSDGTILSGMLDSLQQVGVLQVHGLVVCTAEWSGRP